MNDWHKTRYGHTQQYKVFHSTTQRGLASLTNYTYRKCKALNGEQKWKKDIVLNYYFSLKPYWTELEILSIVRLHCSTHCSNPSRAEYQI